MKLLFAIPHYYAAAPPDTARGGRHGSDQQRPAIRAAVLAEAMLAVHQLFGPAQGEIDIAQRKVFPANTGSAHEIRIVVCTTGDAHLLPRLHALRAIFRHEATSAEPPLLGFECHRVLRERAGEFDYYCYLEDDLVLHDPFFFAKLQQFAAATESLDVLQPNRYEIAARGAFSKAYVDGDIRPAATAAFQNVAERPALSTTFLGMRIDFRRALNPHSGCFFLNRDQMAHWAAQPHFLDRDTRFVGPLESAATLGLMKTFRVYKPARSCASFLEIRHADPRFIHLIGKPTAPPAAS